MNLSAFLHPVQPEPKEVMISDRFRGEDGKPIPFKIRPLTQEENAALVKRYSRAKTVKGQQVETFDSAGFTAALVVAATVEPNFADADLCKAYGVLDPNTLPGKMLLSGEFSKLAREISSLSGFDDDLEEQAKN